MKLAWILLVVSFVAAGSYGAEIRTKADQNIAGVIRKAMDENFRHAMKIGNAELGIPIFDPFVVDHFNVPVKNAHSSLFMTVDELTVDNLGLYKIDQLSVDGCQMTMKLANSRLRINGFYTVEGIFQGMTIFAHGPLELAAHQLTLNGSATLAKRGDSGELLGIDSVRFSTETRLLATRFMNIPLVGQPGASGADLNLLLGHDLYKKLLALINSQLGQAVELYLNHHVQSVPRPLLDALRAGENGNANDYMDQVLALVREQIIANGLDHVSLPDGDLSFSMPFWPFGTVGGGVFLTKGFLTGMETIHRVGDATLSYNGDIVYFESDMGINNAGMGYNIAITFLDIGPRGSLAGTITYANFYFKARIDLLAGDVTVENVNIKDIGHISTDVTGLGIFNWLAELIADLAINLLKGLIKEILEGPIKAIINNVLHSVLDMFRPTTAAVYVAAKLLA